MEKISLLFTKCICQIGLYEHLSLCQYIAAVYLCVHLRNWRSRKVSVSKDALFFSRNLSNDFLEVHKVSNNQPILTLYLSIEPKYNWVLNVQFSVPETKCFNIWVPCCWYLEFWHTSSCSLSTPVVKWIDFDLKTTGGRSLRRV